MKVKRQIKIESIQSRKETIVIAEDPSLPVFHLNDRSILLKDFTIKGAAQSAGVFLQRDFKDGNPSGACGVHDNLITENKYGCHINNSNLNFIEDNIISGNSEYGLFIEGQDYTPRKIYSEFTHVYGNFIGTNESGTAAMPNRIGVYLYKSHHNTIGIPESYGTQMSECKNVISGNLDAGIYIEKTREGYIQAAFSQYEDTLYSYWTNEFYLGTREVFEDSIINRAYQNYIIGNYIGTDNDGFEELPNQYGIYDIASRNTFIGYPNDWLKGSDATGPNIISGNTEAGILLEKSWGTIIQGNFIGVGVYGSQALPNKNGIQIKNPETSRINIGHGNFRDHHFDYTHDQAANLISGNTETGIKIEDCRKTYGYYDRKSVNIVINSNIIGISSSFLERLPNQIGIYLKNTNFILALNNSIGCNTESGIKLESTDNIPNQNSYIRHNKIGAAFSSKNKFGNGIGIDIKNSKNNEIFDNHIWYNCKAYRSENSTSNIIEKNSFKANSCNNTGIHLINATPLIVGNTITQDAGDAIRCEAGANPIIVNNNILNNEGFGLTNLDASVTIGAQGNYWGDNTGPGGVGPGSGEEISGQVDFSGWLEKPVVVLVTHEIDTLFIPAGVTVTIPLHFQNWLFPDDILDVTITDSLGWLEDPSELTIELIEDEETDTLFTVSPPLEAEDMRENIIKIDVRSQTDPGITYLDTILTVAYRQLAHNITIRPDSLVIEVGDQVRFSAECYDQLGRSMETKIEWNASGGTIDTSGVFTAGNEQDDVIITASSPESGAYGVALVQVVPFAGMNPIRQNRLPLDFFLSQNYPNPFNPQTTILYGVKEPCHVELIVYDIRGREVIKLVNENQSPGYYTTTFGAARLASGLYLYRIQMKDFVKVKKMVLLE